MIKDKVHYDVIVIGGGPAGMMAAGRAGECGAKVALIEKNTVLGKKLLITGGGRCNLTNFELDLHKFIEKFKDNGKFLFSAFSQWGVKETLDFFHSRKLETKVEVGGRIFPMNDKAESVFEVLENYITEKSHIDIFTGKSVKELIVNKKNKDKIESVIFDNGEQLSADSFILATGGKSRPETGSTGDGFVWLEKIGHTVMPSNPSLVPVAIKDEWVKSLQGVTVSDVKITVFQNEKKQFIKKGRILFTHFGISGPTVINMSKDIGELLKYGEVNLSIDIFPNDAHDMLNEKLQKLFKKECNKKFKNAISSIIINTTLIDVIIKFARIDSEIFCHSITREDRMRLIKVLKNIHMQVEGLLGVEKAIITSGGVSLSEVDFKTMRSRIFKNLFLVGDILDIDRPSGGYSLQLCWTTGYVAGTHSVKKFN